MNDQPTTLDEAVDLLVRDVTEADKALFLAHEDATFHHTTGRAMRNEWGLWHDSPLAQWFKEHGIFHADDMSSCIMKAFRARLTSKPFDIAVEADWYRRYWEWSNSAVGRGNGSFRIRTRKDGSICYPFEDDYETP